MEFLAHRGQWNNLQERNTFPALKRALDNGFGLETDVRDLDGRLVISHDMPRGTSSLSVEDLFAFYAKSGFTATLALNIKADCLQPALSELLSAYGIPRYFVFDMSIPDSLSYLKAGVRTFIRESELEHYPDLQRRAAGTWLDELTEPWLEAATIVEALERTPFACLVSPELHGREPARLWLTIKAALENPECADRLALCTDNPEKAKSYFS